MCLKKTTYSYLVKEKNKVQRKLRSQVSFKNKITTFHNIRTHFKYDYCQLIDDNYLMNSLSGFRLS